MGEIVSLPGDRHSDTQLLLPFYVNGTLDSADRLLVEAHLAECNLCRHEAEDERVLARVLNQGTSAAGSGWDELEARLGSAAIAQPWPRSAARRQLRGPSAPKAAGMRWIIAGQAVAIAAMAAFLVLGQIKRPTEYTALGDPSTVRKGNVLAMFRPDMSERSLRTLLRRSGARLVDGPTEAGAYVLAIPGRVPEQSLEILRKDRDVTMAEPIEEAPAE